MRHGICISKKTDANLTWYRDQQLDCCNNYSRDPGSVTSMLKDIGWPTLEARRKLARLRVIVNKLHRKKVVSRWSADHVPTTYQPHTDHLPTTYQPLTNHLPTTYRPSTDHLPTTYQPPTDHLPTTFLRCSLFTITQTKYVPSHFLWQYWSWQRFKSNFCSFQRPHSI